MLTSLSGATARAVAILISSFLLALLAGCASVSVPDNKPLLAPVVVSATPRRMPDPIEHHINRPDDLWGVIAHDLTWRDEHPAITRERQRILAQAGFFQLLSERASPSLQWIVNEVHARGLPMELALVPLIESMLDPLAFSSQRAAGLWQISPATAIHYGLPQTWWFDARLDKSQATAFAFDYLTELYQAFDDDWYLALAAYNCGRGCVNSALARAQKSGKPQDFWSLSLPRETRHYVPRLLALAEIIKSPETYAVTLPKLSPTVDVVQIPAGGQIEFARAAELLKITEAQLRALNPAHLQWATAPPPYDKLWVPIEQAEAISSALTAIPEAERVRWLRYTIKPGDTLIKIAREHRTQVNVLREINQIDGHFIRAGRDLLIPSDGTSGSALSRTLSYSRPQHHRVRSGDSLWRIARQYRVALEQLMQLNNLDSHSILRPGQRLRVAP